MRMRTPSTTSTIAPFQKRLCQKLLQDTHFQRWLRVKEKLETTSPTQVQPARDIVQERAVWNPRADDLEWRDDILAMANRILRHRDINMPDLQSRWTNGRQRLWGNREASSCYCAPWELPFSESLQLAAGEYVDVDPAISRWIGDSSIEPRIGRVTTGVTREIVRETIVIREPSEVDAQASPVPVLHSGTAVCTESPQPEEPTPNNCFCRNGLGWTIRFGGKEIQCRESLGADYVSILLQDPDRWVSAEELRAIGSDYYADVQLGEKFCNNEYEQSLVRYRRKEDSECLTDKKAQDEIRARFEGLDSQIDEAEKRGDLDKAQQLDEERAKLERHLKSATGLRGRRRKWTDDQTKAANAVTQALARFYKNLETEHPQLSKHLKMSIIRDEGHYRYTPTAPIHWITSK